MNIEKARQSIILRTENRIHEAKKYFWERVRDYSQEMINYHETRLLGCNMVIEHLQLNFNNEQLLIEETDN